MWSSATELEMSLTLTYSQEEDGTLLTDKRDKKASWLMLKSNTPNYPPNYMKLKKIIPNSMWIIKHPELIWACWHSDCNSRWVTSWDCSSNVKQLLWRDSIKILLFCSFCRIHNFTSRSVCLLWQIGEGGKRLEKKVDYFLFSCKFWIKL